MNDDGVMEEGRKKIAAVLKEYFIKLFSTDGDCDMTQVIESVEPKVTSDMNEYLNRAYTPEEVKQALNQMHPTKAPGQDGMPPLFFQNIWSIVEPSFVATCLGILNHGHDPTSLNLTYIVLIPKTKNPKNAKDFRPISLCNVIMHVISSVIANRLKGILDQVISPNQSAFIPNKLITDNAMIAFEVFHHMRKKKVGKKGFLALKLDMSKAYDRVEWPFLRAMCTKLGISKKWIKLVLKCVCTVKYSILLNGRPTESFFPQRGLRQGDPLSPYLFLICEEGFSSLLRRTERRGDLTGFQIARTAPPITHLFFANDSILFFRSTQ